MISDLTIVFRDNLEAILDKHKIRKYKLSLAMHRNASAVYQWTNGDRTVSLDAVCEVARALATFGVGVSPWELLVPGRFAKR